MNLSSKAILTGKEALIEQLHLERHDEGGYFRQIYQSDWMVPVEDRPGVTRYGLNTIYYMLTDDSPIGHLHRNASDIVHFFHAGSPMQYWLISPEGVLSRVILGPDPEQGHVFQMTVPGGYWKASVLLEGQYGLLSEAVAPGFDYRDREIATEAQIAKEFPQLLLDVISYIYRHN